jgi:hypothetical protein
MVQTFEESEIRVCSLHTSSKHIINLFKITSKKSSTFFRNYFPITNSYQFLELLLVMHWSGEINSPLHLSFNSIDG